MSLLHLIWRNLMRKRLRSLFTLMSVLVAFVLFTYMAAIQLAFTLGVDVTGEDRLVVIHKTSLIMPLPESYLERLATTDGVMQVTHSSWFGGKYQNYPEGRFPIFVVDPQKHLQLYPEFRLPTEQVEAWNANRVGVIVGRRTARDMGFHDITDPEVNVHAGVKYIRWLMDKKFSDEGFSEDDRLRFALAAYNAGPGNIRKSRAVARKNGYDPMQWFGHTEMGTLKAVDCSYRYIEDVGVLAVVYPYIKKLQLNPLL